MLMASDAAYRSGSQDAEGFAPEKLLIRSNVKVIYQLRVPK